MKRMTGFVARPYCMHAFVVCFCLIIRRPLEVKTYPIFLPINKPYLEQAAPENSFAVSLSHSSVFVMEDKTRWTAHMELELTELNVSFIKKH